MDEYLADIDKVDKKTAWDLITKFDSKPVFVLTPVVDLISDRSFGIKFDHVFVIRSAGRR